MTLDDPAVLAALETRIRTILPEEYQDCYDEVQPVSMGSAGLRFGSDGKVAWNEMWGSFCDLAMAGGPPHKGTLLEPASPSEIEAHTDRYHAVTEEICRGVEMVTGLSVQPSPASGWVRMACLNEGMAQWLLRAIVMENVAARVEGAAIDLPAGPRFRLEKEIKNVVTVAAKTCHYWLGHTSRTQQRRIGDLFMTMGAESPLVEPPVRAPGTDGSDDAVIARMTGAIHEATGLMPSSRRYAGWLGIECPSVRAAIWMMRAVVVSNVLSRREETTLFVPMNPVQDSRGDRVVAATIRACRLARVKGIT